MGVFTAAGSRLSKSAALATLTADTSNVPLVAGQDLYDSAYSGQEDPAIDGSVRRVLVKAGQKISTSEFNRLFLAPTIDTLSPASTSAAGGATVTITGNGLDGTTAVSVGGTAATSVAYSQSGKVLTFVVPAKVAGTYNVVLTDDSGNVTLPNALTTV